MHPVLFASALLVFLTTVAAASPKASSPSIAVSTPIAPSGLEPDARDEHPAASAAAAQAIAAAYGVQSTYKIEAISFVYTVQQGDRTTRREWFWDIADNRIEFQGNGPTGLPIEVVYRRDQITTGNAVLNRTIDDWFVDDQFWLLFPYHLAWEKGLVTGLTARAQPPISPLEMRSLSLRYPVAAPRNGDGYEIFFGPDHLIREWVVNPTDPSVPAIAMTWERNAKAGPFLFAMAHRSSDGNTHSWFERISVKVADEGWIDAVPLEQEISQGNVAMDRKPQRL